jgi:hypothetical protein
MTDNEFIPQEGPKGFANIWRRIILDPQAFFRAMPSSAGFENPLIFVAVCGLLYFIFRLIVNGLPDAVNNLFLICLAYVFGPGILMLVSQFVFQGEGDYEGSLRICAYAGACLALAWVPALGILAYVYSVYLVFLGTEQVHKLDPTKAVLTTLIAVLVTAVIMAFVLKDIRHPLF